MQQLLKGKRPEPKRLPAELSFARVPAHRLLHPALHSQTRQHASAIMKKVITFLLIMVGVAGVLWVAKGWTPRRTDPKAAKFNADAENLILGLQQFREFTGSYPTGNNIAIAKALLGQPKRRC